MKITKKLIDQHRAQHTREEHIAWLVQAFDAIEEELNRQ